MWPKVHFRVMSSTSKITKRDKQMYLMWTVPITHLRHAFMQCCVSFPLLRWVYLFAMAAAIKNMDSAVTWPRYQTKKSEGSRVPDYPIFPSIFNIILMAKNLLTGSLKNRSIDNLEPQKKSISMKNSQFFDYLLYAKSK
jgi:hypothetical protein